MGKLFDQLIKLSLLGLILCSTSCFYGKRIEREEAKNQLQSCYEYYLDNIEDIERTGYHIQFKRLSSNFAADGKTYKELEVKKESNNLYVYQVYENKSTSGKDIAEVNYYEENSKYYIENLIDKTKSETTLELYQNYLDTFSYKFVLDVYIRQSFGFTSNGSQSYYSNEIGDLVLIFNNSNQIANKKVTSKSIYEYDNYLFKSFNMTATNGDYTKIMVEYNDMK